MAVEQNARVLVVDDDPLFVEAMLVLLPQMGLEPVACALDGAEAIAVAKQHAPDVVLVDLDMPLVDGVEAIKQISQALPKSTVVAVTGSLEPQRAASAIAAGAVACISKVGVRSRLEELLEPT